MKNKKKGMSITGKQRAAGWMVSGSGNNTHFHNELLAYNPGCYYII